MQNELATQVILIHHRFRTTCESLGAQLINRIHSLDPQARDVRIAAIQNRVDKITSDSNS